VSSSGPNFKAYEGRQCRPNKILSLLRLFWFRAMEASKGSDILAEHIRRICGRQTSWGWVADSGIATVCFCLASSGSPVVGVIYACTIVLWLRVFVPGSRDRRLVMNSARILPCMLTVTTLGAVMSVAYMVYYVSGIGFHPAGFNTFRDQFGSFVVYGDVVFFPLLLAESWLNLLGWQIREFEAEYRTLVMASFVGHIVPVVPIAIGLWNRRLAIVGSLRWKRESDKVLEQRPPENMNVHSATPRTREEELERSHAQKEMRKMLWRASLGFLVIVVCIVALLYLLQEMLVIAAFVFLFGCLIIIMIAGRSPVYRRGTRTFVC
jgi:hypothetical protein